MEATPNVKLRSPFLSDTAGAKPITVGRPLSSMPAIEEVGDTQDDPFLQDAFLRDMAYVDVRRPQQQFEDDDLAELAEDAYLDEELLAGESHYRTILESVDNNVAPEAHMEAPSAVTARQPRPRRGAPRLGQSASTVCACILGLLVAGVAFLPHLQASWTAFAATQRQANGAKQASAQSASQQASKCTWYTVVSGDTLSGISAQRGVSVETLVTANQLADPNLILTGQVLCIPAGNNAEQSAAVHGEEAFVQYALPYARRAHADTGWPVSLILAQWGLEQGWETPRFTGYNWGNCGAYPGEPTVPGTSAPGSPAAFAYAPGPEDGLRIYLHVAHLSYYAAIAPAAQNGPDAAARALGASPWDAGHYTDHGDPGSSLIAIMQDFNLYQYD